MCTTEGVVEDQGWYGDWHGFFEYFLILVSVSDSFLLGHPMGGDVSTNHKSSNIIELLIN